MDKTLKTSLGRDAGFSLMELMIVVAIMGLMAAISLPALMNPENKARKAARELMSDMQKTRMSAIKANQDWAIVFDVAANNYTIYSGPGADEIWSTTNDNPPEKTVSFTGYGSGIQYGAGTATAPVPVAGVFSGGVSYTSDLVTFNPQGTCKAGYVYLYYGDVTYAIGTQSTGIIKIFRWTGGGWE